MADREPAPPGPAVWEVRWEGLTSEGQFDCLALLSPGPGGEEGQARRQQVSLKIAAGPEPIEVEATLSWASGAPLRIARSLSLTAGERRTIILGDLRQPRFQGLCEPVAAPVTLEARAAGRLLARSVASRQGIESLGLKVLGPAVTPGFSPGPIELEPSLPCARLPRVAGFSWRLGSGGSGTIEAWLPATGQRAATKAEAPSREVLDSGDFSYHTIVFPSLSIPTVACDTFPTFELAWRETTRGSATDSPAVTRPFKATVGFVPRQIRVSVETSSPPPVAP